MLTSGMVPALFADDEKEAIVGQVRTYPMCSVVKLAVHVGIRTYMYIHACSFDTVTAMMNDSHA